MAFDIPAMIHGSKPQVAPFKKVDYGAEQLKAINENIAAFPEFSQLGTLYQDFLLSGIENLIPNYADILKEGGMTTDQMYQAASPLLQGQIPQDVQDQVYRSGAFQSLLASGGESGMHQLQARDLGLTSLNLINQGAQLAGQAGNAAQRFQQMAMATELNPAAFMISPQQQAQLTWANNIMKQLVQQERYNVAAAPDPAAAGIAGTLMNLVGAYVGHGMGGGGGSPSSFSSFGQFDQSGVSGTDVGTVTFGGQRGGVVPTQRFQGGGQAGGGQFIPPYSTTGIPGLDASFMNALAGMGNLNLGGGAPMNFPMPSGLQQLISQMATGGGAGYAFPQNMFAQPQAPASTNIYQDIYGPFSGSAEDPSLTGFDPYGGSIQMPSLGTGAEGISPNPFGGAPTQFNLSPYGG